MDVKILMQDLANGMSGRSGLPKKESDSFTRTFFDIIEQYLLEDKIVKIKGLGTFKVVEVSGRDSVNVNTGERIHITGHSKITFTPDAAIRDHVNRPFADFETVILNDGVDRAAMEFVEKTEETPDTDTAEEELLDETAVDELEQFKSDELATEETAAEEPVTEEPVVEEPAVEEPTSEEPGAEEPEVDVPAAEEPAAEESVVEEPVAEEAAAEEPAAEEPAAEEPINDEPAIVEESVVEEPAAEEPIDDMLVTIRAEIPEIIPSDNEDDLDVTLRPDQVERVIIPSIAEQIETARNNAEALLSSHSESAENEPETDVTLRAEVNHILRADDDYSDDEVAEEVADAEQNLSDSPATEELTSDNSVADEAIDNALQEKSNNEEPVEEASVIEELSEETDAVKEPTEESFVVEDSPIVEELVEENSITEEPVEECPIVDEPAEESSIIDEPVEESPFVDEPAEENPIVDETPFMPVPQTEPLDATEDVSEQLEKQEAVQSDKATKPKHDKSVRPHYEIRHSVTEGSVEDTDVLSTPNGGLIKKLGYLLLLLFVAGLSYVAGSRHWIGEACTHQPQLIQETSQPKDDVKAVETVDNSVDDEEENDAYFDSENDDNAGDFDDTDVTDNSPVIPESKRQNMQSAETDNQQKPQTSDNKQNKPQEKPAVQADEGTNYPQVNGGEYIITGVKTVHKLKRGESVNALARRYLGDMEMGVYIIKLNNLRNPDVVEVGDELKIPKLKKK